MNNPMALQRGRVDRVFQTEIMAILIVLLLALITAMVVWRVGENSRSVVGQPQVFVVRNESDAFDIWRRAGIRGRVMIHFGKHLPMEPVDSLTLARIMISGRAGSQYSERPSDTGLTDDNYLYAASRANFIRKINTVVQESEWPRVKARLKQSRKFSVEHDYATAWLDGLQVTAGRLSALATLREPALLNFSADYFMDKDISAVVVYAKLRQIQAQPQIVTIAVPPARTPGAEAAVKKIGDLKALLEAQAR